MLVQRVLAVAPAVEAVEVAPRRLDAGVLRPHVAQHIRVDAAGLPLVHELHVAGGLVDDEAEASAGENCGHA